MLIILEDASPLHILQRTKSFDMFEQLTLLVSHEINHLFSDSLIDDLFEVEHHD
jgi:hypothetical protein